MRRNLTKRGWFPHYLPPVVDIATPSMVAIGLISALSGNISLFMVAMIIRWWSRK